MREILRHINTEQAMKHITDGEEVVYEEAADLIKSPETFAQRVSAESFAYDGFTVTQQSIELGVDEFGKEHFSNMYDLSFPLVDNQLDARVVTLRQPQYQHRLFNSTSAERLPHVEVLATINGAFFYLQDDTTLPTPKEIMYNLNIRNGNLVGLPSANRPALITNIEGDLCAVELKAVGELQCGDTFFKFKGGQSVAHGREAYSTAAGEVYLFNSACCTIAYENPDDKKSLRKLQQDKNRTPSNPSVVDIVVSANKETGVLEVVEINKGGGTDFFAGNFILQGDTLELSDLKEGAVVLPRILDGIDVATIESAMTAGPMVHHFLQNQDHEINHDPSLGTFPPFSPKERYARSVIYADKNNIAHLVVFDAVPRSVDMKGVTPKEAASHIPQDAQWAVFLDGGQSSRISFKDEEGEVDSRGNSQYIRLHKRAKNGQSLLCKGGEDQYLWSRRGREVPSVITLSKKSINS